MNSFLFHEKTPHGTPDFPCEYHYIDTTHPRYNMPFHWHKEWEIIHVVEGVFRVHADNHLYTAQKGDILLLRDGMLHGGTPEKCIYECILFDLHGFYRNYDILKKYIRPIYRHDILPDIFYPAGKITEIDNAVKMLTTGYQNFSTDNNLQNPLELMVFTYISQLFTAILQHDLYTLNNTTDADSPQKIYLLKNILEYIELQYSRNITLDELANVAGMNPNYFCKYFRSIIHQTPMEYVNIYRIEKATQLLHSTNLSITEVGMECGFNDSSHFIKVFRKYKGMTPMQYRKA